MCLTCHINIADTEIHEQLQDSISHPGYHVWNSTSINHLIFICSGYNGAVNRALGLESLENYYNWLKRQIQIVHNMIFYYNKLIIKGEKK